MRFISEVKMVPPAGKAGGAFWIENSSGVMPAYDAKVYI